jgi:hypothetical protein
MHVCGLLCSHFVLKSFPQDGKFVFMRGFLLTIPINSTMIKFLLCPIVALA